MTQYLNNNAYDVNSESMRSESIRPGAPHIDSSGRGNESGPNLDREGG